MRIPVFALLLAIVPSPPAFGQVIRSEDLATFIDKSAAQYDLASKADFESVLYEIAKRHPAPEVAIAEFAKRLGTSIHVANGYAAALVESVAAKMTCFEHRQGCTFAAGDPSHTLIVRAGTLDSSGRLLAAVAKNLLNTGIDGGASGAAFVSFVAAHPGAEVVFRELLDWSEDPVYLAGLLATSARLDDPATLAEIAAASADDKPEALGWIDAMLEGVERDPTRVGSPVARATIAQAAILRKLKRGLDADALEHYDGLPRDIRVLLPQPRGACTKTARHCERRARSAYRFVDDMSAALAAAGRRQEALALLHRRLVDLGPRSSADKRRHDAILDALLSTRRRDDLFDFYLRGYLRGRPPRNHDDDFHGFDGAGWLFTINGSSPAVQRLAAARLRAAGYADIAASLGEARELGEQLEQRDAFDALASTLPSRVRERRIYWEQRARAAPVTASSKPAATPLTVSRRELPRWWVERPLPTGIEPWSESDVAEKPDDRQLPVDAEMVLRFERVGAECALVYESSDYDLPGEIPALGLWFAQTVGGKWGRPVYLGLQQHYPYVVTHGSRLSLLDGTTLRLEVQVREIDSGTVSFPPIGLRLARSAAGIYLEMDLGRLQMDSDGDGLPDIEEQRIGLDFSNPDSDGDSLTDGVDPLPLTSFSSRGFALSGLARAILSQVTNHDAQVIVVPVRAGNRPLELFEAVGAPRRHAVHTPAGAEFLIADSALFSSVVTSKRLMIYSDADISELRRGAAPFYLPRIGPIFSSLDGRRHYVSWSARWTGGAFIVTCDASGTCDVEVLSSWIT